jgi:uncharacterized protein YbjT (DUF2867 family)
MKVLLTGASGFIGQYVLNQLLKENIEVIRLTDIGGYTSIQRF